MSDFNEKFLKFRFGIGKRLSFYKRLMAYTEEGYPVYDTLVKFKSRLDKRKDPVGKIIAYWILGMKQGRQFSQVIEGWVPDSEINLISAGERGEGIQVGLKEAIRFTEAAQKMKAVIIGGSIYPGALILMALVFMGSFSAFLSPTFAEIMPINIWSPDAQVLQSTSEFLVSYWPFIVGILFGLGVLVNKTINVWTNKARKIFDKIPPWSIYKSYNMAAFLITLSSMMKSGIALNDSLKSMHKISSPWLKKYLDAMMLNLKKGGKNFGIALDVGLMDEETAGDIIDYSELGKFEKAVHSIGEQSIEKTISRIEAQMSIAKNLLLFLVAGIVGWIYFTNYNLSILVAEYAQNAKPMPQKAVQMKK